tara:strand:+ start:252 stop:1031 length:780 start_codon:yes stop_codon:yes gene_type:complete
MCSTNSCLGSLGVEPYALGHWRWTDAGKARAEADTLEPTASKSSVVERYAIYPNPLSKRRCLVKQSKLMLPAAESEDQVFAPLVVREAAKERTKPEMPAQEVVILIAQGVVAIQLGHGTATFHLGPVVDRLTEHLLSSGTPFMVQTTAPVLDPGRGRTKTGYFWALARDDRERGGDNPHGGIFTLQPSRVEVHAEQISQGFDCILQLDGYAGYDRLTRPSRNGGALITVAYSWAHARCKLRVFDRDGSEIAAGSLRRNA